jgi:hypothetical protein
MKISEGGSYDPETIALLRTVLDAAWDALSHERRARITKPIWRSAYSTLRRKESATRSVCSDAQ